MVLSLHAYHTCHTAAIKLIMCLICSSHFTRVALLLFTSSSMSYCYHTSRFTSLHIIHHGLHALIA